ncbi:hypothetical protein AO367_0266 [Moraxella catarrhalis]|nr:hypothetical protein AO367_0266 [Moraxella catarrhalis]
MIIAHFFDQKLKKLLEMLKILSNNIHTNKNDLKPTNQNGVML